jgi:hypothetical protein
MALSRIDTTNMIEDVPQSKLDNNINFRNIIINGDMSLAQRGTSTSSITSTGYHTVDRLQTEISSFGTWTQSQSTDVPSGQGFAKSLKMDCTTADASPSASDFLVLTQKVEGQNLQYLKKGTSNAESVTLSFWVKSNKTGTYIAELYDSNNRQISKAYTVDSASTWEKKTLTFDGDTTGTLTNSNATGLFINFWLGAGSDRTSGTLNTSWNSATTANRVVGQVNLADSASNEWYITGVQLEAGQVASDFEFLPFDVNENRCLRYFRVVGDTVSGSVAFGNGFTGAYNNTTQVIAGRQLPIRMRTSPTVTLSALSTFDLEPFDVPPSSLSAQSSSPNEVILNADDPSARTKGFACVISIDTAGGYVRMDAEL